MAIVTFGSTVRAHDALGIKNQSANPLVLNLLHGVVVAPGAVKYLSFTFLDGIVRDANRRAGNLYDLNSDGVTHYLDDINEFAKLVVAHTVLVYAATVSGSTYTLGASAAYSATGDGSVTYS